ncbi:MAG: VWA domain-containing protein [Acidobacteria bacterium]|nr:VWA domain-containing protein [Acidobacteriota bacterium]
MSHGTVVLRVGATAIATALALLVVNAQQPVPQVVPRAAQQSPPDPRATFRSDITCVEIPTVVVDRQGRFVTGLTRDDFEVFEEGQRQAVETFRSVDFGPVAKSTTSATLPDPDVSSNEAPFDGRIYVLVLDDMHTKPMATGLTRDLARRFVETQVGANDLAAVVFPSGIAGTSQDFTSSQRRLFAAIDRFVGGRGGSVSFDLNYESQTSLLALRLVVNALAEIRGRRKAVVLFSGGIPPILLSGQEQRARTGDRPPGAPPKWFGLAQSDLAGTVAAAIQSNTTIYAVDPDGLKMGSAACLNPPLETLRRLSWDTGGQVAVNTNSLNEALDRIGEDNSRYYLLGYYPLAPKQDGSFRKLEVKVHKPDVGVYARVGYYSKKAEGSPAKASTRTKTREPELLAALQEALDSPTPVSGVRIRASAAPFRNAAGKAAVTVVIQVDGRDIGFSQAEGRFDASVNLAIVAVDSVGDTIGMITRTFTLPLRPDSHTQMVANGLRLAEQLSLPTGPHRLHIAVQDAVNKRVGAVDCDVDVPDFGKTVFTMSGLLLTSSRANATPSTKNDRLQALQSVLPTPPTVARVFGRDESLTLMAEVYDRSRTPNAVTIVTTVRTADGTEVFRREGTRTGAELKSAKGVYQHLETVPLSSLAPGCYVLTVEASSGGKPESSIRRQVPIDIVVQEGSPV